LALVFGAAVQMLAKAKREPLEKGLNILTAAMYQFTHVVMWSAPIGAFGAMAYTIGSNGMSVLVVLSWWVLGYYVRHVAVILVLHGLICALFRVNLFRILGFIKDEIFIVLGTASSESALPRLLEKLPAMGVSRQTTGLVLPTGYVFNLGGAAIYL